jgi:hypothetical protein
VVAIWESTRDAFLQAFPEYNAAAAAVAASGSVVSVGGNDKKS